MQSSVLRSEKNEWVTEGARSQIFHHQSNGRCKEEKDDHQDGSWVLFILHMLENGAQLEDGITLVGLAAFLFASFRAFFLLVLHAETQERGLPRPQRTP